MNSVVALGQSTSYIESHSAGSTILSELNSIAPSDINEYITTNKLALSTHAIQFLSKYTDEITALCNAMNSNLDMDYIVASMMKANYCTKVLQSNGELRTSESPIQLYMRVACTLCGFNYSRFNQVLQDLSNRKYNHGSATLFNASMRRPQMSSCFLTEIDDNYPSIMNAISESGFISKESGGIGLSLSKLRHSVIRNTGYSKGILPIMKLLDRLIEYSDQGGRRKGAMTVYLRTHHIDIYDFLEAVNRHANPSHRIYRLTFAVWLSDLFMDRVRSNSTWTLFCPHVASKLNDLYGPKFTKQYLAYEEQRSTDPFLQRWSRVVDARELFVKMVKMSSESARLYLMNGDAANMLSNQAHLAPIHNSNLCTEITQVSSSKHISSCNIATINLASCVEADYTSYPSEVASIQAYNFNELARLSREVTNNLDNVLDYTWYFDDIPELSAKVKDANLNLRNIGVGVCGFWDALCKMNIGFTTDIEGTTLNPLVSKFNRCVFACIYFNVVAQSVWLAQKKGQYTIPEDLTDTVSPLEQGLFKFDLYAKYRVERNNAWSSYLDTPVEPSEWMQLQIDLPNGDTIQPTWSDLRRVIKLYGTRHSEFTTIMPTSNTATLCRVCENVQPPDELMFTKKLANGQYMCHNELLYPELEARFGSSIAEAVLQYVSETASIKGVERIVPSSVKQDVQDLAVKYLRCYEIRPSHLIYLAAERMRYISQSHSLNIFLDPNTFERVHQCITYGYNLGLTTLLYYIYNHPARQNQDFTSNSCSKKDNCSSCSSN